MCAHESAVCDKERLCVTMLYLKESCVKGSLCVCKRILCERLCVKELCARDSLSVKELCVCV